MAIDLNEAPPEGDQDVLLEHELLAIDLNKAPPEGDQDGLLEHELLNEALVEEQDGVLPVHEQDGVLPVNEQDEVNLHEGGENYGFYPFDLNITLGDDEEEGLHPGMFLNEMLLVFFLPLLCFISLPSYCTSWKHVSLELVCFIFWISYGHMCFICSFNLFHFIYLLIPLCTHDFVQMKRMQWRRMYVLR